MEGGMGREKGGRRGKEMRGGGDKKGEKDKWTGERRSE